MLAYKLKCSIKQIEQMRMNEFIEWIAFFDLEESRQHGKFR